MDNMIKPSHLICRTVEIKYLLLQIARNLRVEQSVLLSDEKERKANVHKKLVSR